MNLREMKRNHFVETPLSKRIFRNYCIVLAAYALVMVAMAYLAYNVLQGRIWWPTDPLWPILHWLDDNVMLVGVIVCLLGWLVITLWFEALTLRYLHETVRASRQLASRLEEPIVLPAAMKEIQDELNGVRERTQRSAYLAKEAEQRKNDLIVYLAHDLKTPLTSVIGYLTLLSDEPDLTPEMRAKYTGIALDKAQRLETLINEFFEIARFNLTTMQLEVTRIDLTMLLEQLASEFLPILKEKNLTLKSAIEPGVSLVCDPDKLERVFDNLLRNAINYSYPDSEITLSMNRSGSGQEIVIRLKNHGRTITKEKLSHIFEQFYRLDSSRCTATGGAGLGLAIAKEIVELHGGTITAASEQETILFTVTLPLENVRNS